MSSCRARRQAHISTADRACCRYGIACGEWDSIAAGWDSSPWPTSVHGDAPTCCQLVCASTCAQHCRCTSTSTSTSISTSTSTGAPQCVADGSAVRVPRRTGTVHSQCCGAYDECGVWGFCEPSLRFGCACLTCMHSACVRSPGRYPFSICVCARRSDAPICRGRAPQWSATCTCSCQHERHSSQATNAATVDATSFAATAERASTTLTSTAAGPWSAAACRLFPGTA